MDVDVDDPIEEINRCLAAIHADKNHTPNQEFVAGRTFDELLYTLLAARTAIRRRQQYIDEYEKRVELLMTALGNEGMKSIETQWEAISNSRVAL
jgi:ribosome assembly protein YihI (activator of Der GTPase)